MKKLIALIAAIAINVSSAIGISNVTTNAPNTIENAQTNSGVYNMFDGFDLAAHFENVLSMVKESRESYNRTKEFMNRVYEVDESILRGPHHPNNENGNENTDVTRPAETVPPETTPTEPTNESVIPPTTVPETTEPEETTVPPTEPASTTPSITETTEPTHPETQKPTEPIQTEPPHEHHYQESYRKNATCTEVGNVVYTCSCGDSYGRKTGSLGHDWSDWKVIIEPTYETRGEEGCICYRCGAKDTIPIPQLRKKLSNEDAAAIAKLTLQYINEIRNKQGSQSAVDMPGCTAYAKLRSEQMAAKGVADHSYSDSIAAATQLQYGRYIDPSVYGMPGDPYYQVYGGEAVGTGYGSTIEEVARCLANGVSSSPAHWNYVGKDANVYMSVAVTYSKGCWYCCIITSTVDLDTNPLGY